jgi:proteasome lid subunit RPN8/RPN11
VLPARNERRGEAAERGYLIAPETVLAARREAHRLGFEVVGYYHSHPDRPAEPSATDREDAWPGMSYLIVSVEEGRPVAARSWRLEPDRGTFTEEGLEAVGHPARPPSLHTAGEVRS